ncbi:MAG: DNA polymerase III subunit gamma/tau, partial [Bacilli bacterium]|nr:DNA polymerase III subunit gamma/tau [Bacilli bacterium]
MGYKVLYRKYRPTNFNELVGQDHIKKILQNSIINNKIAHAYIFTGPRGTGKTSSAKIFARAINCLNQKDGISCGECDNCLNFNTSPDIIEMDAASNNGVEYIRDMIENVGIAPTNSKYKIYIIDEVHMLSSSAWNAFLKTLEEPPSNVIFILATTEIQKVPVTVLSRCQRFDFQRIDRTLIYQNLSNICEKEQIEYEEEALHEISYLSDGCMRDALSILDQLSKVADKITLEVLKSNYGTVTGDDIDTLYKSILKNNLDDLVSIIARIKESGIDIKVLIDKMLDNFIEKAVKMKRDNVSNNAFKQLKKLIDSLNSLLNKINYNSNGYLLLELELISFINDDENQISNRDINQIISREIISSDEKIDVNQMIK